MKRIFLAVLLMLWAGSAWGATYYAHPECTDLAGEQVGSTSCEGSDCTGTTPGTGSNACTLNDAVRKATGTSDDVILLYGSDGLYEIDANYINTPGGTGSRTIKPESGYERQVEVREASGGSIDRIFAINSAADWTFQDFIVSGQTSATQQNTGFKRSGTPSTGTVYIKRMIITNTLTGIDCTSVGNVDVENSLIYSNGKGISLNNSLTNITLKNNTIADNDQVDTLLASWTNTTITNNLWGYNNIFYAFQVQLTNEPQTFTNNGFWSDEDIPSGVPFAFISWGTGATPFGIDASNIGFDPGWPSSRSSASDYALSSSSILVDKGLAVSGTDILGNSRNQGNSTDLGAFESSGSADTVFKITPTKGVVTFVGHSIVEGESGAGWDTSIADWGGVGANTMPGSFASLATGYTVYNRGVGGHTAASAGILALIALEDTNPEWVVLGPEWINSIKYPGTNAAWIGEVATQAIHAIKRAGVDPHKIILCGMIAEDSMPWMIGDTKGSSSKNPENFCGLDVRTVLADVAVQEDVMFVDMYHLLAGSKMATWDTTFWSGSGVDSNIHPSPDGYDLMGKAVYNVFKAHGQLWQNDDYTTATANQVSVSPMCLDPDGDGAVDWVSSGDNDCIITGNTPTPVGIVSYQQIYPWGCVDTAWSGDTITLGNSGADATIILSGGSITDWTYFGFTAGDTFNLTGATTAANDTCSGGTCTPLTIASITTTTSANDTINITGHNFDTPETFATMASDWSSGTRMCTVEDVEKAIVLTSAPRYVSGTMTFNTNGNLPDTITGTITAGTFNAGEWITVTGSISNNKQFQVSQTNATNEIVVIGSVVDEGPTSSVTIRGGYEMTVDHDGRCTSCAKPRGLVRIGADTDFTYIDTEIPMVVDSGYQSFYVLSHKYLDSGDTVTTQSVFRYGKDCKNGLGAGCFSVGPIQ